MERMSPTITDGLLRDINILVFTLASPSIDEIASDALDMFGLSALSSEAIEMVGVPLPGEESAKDPAWLLSMWDENGVCCAQLQLKRKFGMPLIQKINLSKF
uniref:Uncharacterized protein n=1 Tax=Timema tahoe TaxID=61484 RepID=A0A7R9IQX0_9NEOP|nr:unnamed protein product [Timema tahoe]